MKKLSKLERSNLDQARRAYRIYRTNTQQKLDAYRKKRNWNANFSDDDLDELVRILFQHFPLKIPQMTIGYFIGLLEGQLDTYQQYYWLELTQTGPKMRKHLKDMQEAVCFLEKGFEPDNVYYLRPIMSQNISRESVGNVVKSLDELKRGIELRQSILHKKGRKPDGARLFFGVQLANVLYASGINPTTSDNNPFIGILSVILRQQGSDPSRGDALEYLIKEAIRKFKLHKTNRLEPVPFFLPNTGKN